MRSQDRALRYCIARSKSAQLPYSNRPTAVLSWSNIMICLHSSQKTFSSRIKFSVSSGVWRHHIRTLSTLLCTEVEVTRHTNTIYLYFTLSCKKVILLTFGGQRFQRLPFGAAIEKIIQWKLNLLAFKENTAFYFTCNLCGGVLFSSVDGGNGIDCDCE